VAQPVPGFIFKSVKTMVDLRIIMRVRLLKEMIVMKGLMPQRR
jgi:hypothetical protein